MVEADCALVNRWTGSPSRILNLSQYSMRRIVTRSGLTIGGNGASLPTWRSRLIPAALLACAILLLAGCGRRNGPNLGLVHGIVTLKGKPLADAQVVFQPSNGHISCAMTDSDGHYDLIYLRNEHGAIVGSHKVQISTLLPDEGRKEVVPARYNKKSELEREVASGKNEINFDLQ